MRLGTSVEMSSSLLSLKDIIALGTRTLVHKYLNGLAGMLKNFKILQIVLVTKLYLKRS